NTSLATINARSLKFVSFIPASLASKVTTSTINNCKAARR
ncbi:unnamed protein product, partial [Rotaria sordida]